MRSWVKVGSLENLRICQELPKTGKTGPAGENWQHRVLVKQIECDIEKYKKICGKTDDILNIGFLPQIFCNIEFLQDCLAGSALNYSAASQAEIIS